MTSYKDKIAELLVEKDVYFGEEESSYIYMYLIVSPQTILAELHKEHLGVVKMKMLAQSHVWWSSINADLEALVKSHPQCLAVKQPLARALLYSWVWLSRP